MAAFKALMLDVDGVLITPRPGGWAVDLEADLGLAPAALAEHFFALHWDDVVMGRAGLHERLSPVLARIAPHLSSERLTAYWFERDADLDRQLLDDLAEVRAAGIALHLATVQEHLRADYLWTALGFRDRFDAMHYAAALGCGKPDPAFFAKVTERTGLAPAEMLLIDDKAENVEAARAAGWGAALWDGTERLATVLAREGHGTVLRR
jgi:putative hydrolase of the HAD superfamily